MKKEMKKRLMTGACLLCLLLCLSAGCGQHSGGPSGSSSAPNPSAMSDEKEDVLTLFDKNSDRHMFDDRIAQEIMKRTGVRIQVIDSTADAEEREELMFTYQDYPDMIKVDLEAITKYQDAGFLVDLSPYLSELPAVEEMYGDLLNRFRTQDGALYYLGNWYGTDQDAVYGFQIRYDYLKELVGKERADSDEPFTQEEFLELLRAFSEKYPEIGGQPSIPFTTCLDFDYMAAAKGMYGMKNYYEKDGSLQHIVKDPSYIQALSFLNRMYREGLLDKEWVLNRRELFSEKLKSGRVFATATAYWDIFTENSYLRRMEGDDAFYACYKVVGEGTDASETTYGGRNSLGWDAIAVTDHCENLDAALRVINFLASEEGQYLMLWGIEGADWNYVDGVRTPSDRNLALFTQSVTNAVEQTDIRRWIWFIKNGNGSDGSPYDMMTKYQPSLEAQLANRRMQGDYWDTSAYLGLDPESGTEESIMWTSIKNMYDETFPRMVNADSEQSMHELYDRLLQDMEAEGLPFVEAIWTQNYQKRMEQWRE